jgi:exonuclease SbcD
MGDGPLIATGHLTCLGALESAGGPDADSAERRILIGGEHAAPPNIFPLDLAYVALGHLHRPQTVEGRAIRYSGAPFPLSASELSYAHGVTILDIGAELLWRHVDLPRPVPCLRLPARGALAPEELESAIAALGLDPEAPREQQPFVYVVIAPQGPAAGVGLEIERRLEKAPLRCAGVKIVRPALGPIEAPAPVKPLADCDPAELFARAFAQAHGGPPQPQHWAAFDALRQDL